VAQTNGHTFFGGDECGAEHAIADLSSGDFVVARQRIEVDSRLPPGRNRQQAFPDAPSFGWSNTTRRALPSTWRRTPIVRATKQAWFVASNTCVEPIISPPASSTPSMRSVTGS
jgi:hypothetical protein